MTPIEQQTARTSATEVLSLWKQYKRTGDMKVRDRLIFTFTPMVRYIVYRKIREVPAQCEVDDFLSCGVEALIRSIDRYDPARGATLEQYAWTRIHGAVLDELCRHDWAPLSLRRRARTRAHARRACRGCWYDRRRARGAHGRAGARPGRVSEQDDPCRGQ